MIFRVILSIIYWIIVLVSPFHAVKYWLLFIIYATFILFSFILKVINVCFTIIFTTLLQLWDLSIPYLLLCLRFVFGSALFFSLSSESTHFFSLQLLRFWSPSFGLALLAAHGLPLSLTEFQSPSIYVSIKIAIVNFHLFSLKVFVWGRLFVRIVLQFIFPFRMWSVRRSLFHLVRLEAVISILILIFIDFIEYFVKVLCFVLLVIVLCFPC